MSIAKYRYLFNNFMQLSWKNVRNYEHQSNISDILSRFLKFRRHFNPKLRYTLKSITSNGYLRKNLETISDFKCPQNFK